MIKKQLLGIIHLNSVSIKLNIYEILASQTLREIESARQFFAEDILWKSTKVVSNYQIQNLIKILQQFKKKLEEYKTIHVMAVATGNLRKALNQDLMLEQIFLATGFRLVILENAQERYMDNIAVKEKLECFQEFEKNGTMILDVGADSLQSTAYDAKGFIFSQNIDLGSLYVNQLLESFERESENYFYLVEQIINQILDEYYSVQPQGLTNKNLIVFGSDIGFLKKVAGFSHSEYCYLSLDAFKKAFKLISQTTQTELISCFRLPSAAIQLLQPTALIINQLMTYTGAEGIHIPATSLSDGLAFHYAWQNFKVSLKFDPDLDTIKVARHISQRYLSDGKHIRYVEKIALEIFDTSKKIHGLNKRYRLLLQISAILHEVGKFVHVSHHNTRSFHIIDHTDIIGLTKQEKHLVALVCRFYRMNNLVNDRFYQYLSLEHKAIVAKLSAILQIADTLDASHKQRIKFVQLIIDDKKLIFVGESSQDINFEMYTFHQRKDLISQVFALEATFKQRRA